MCQVTAAPQKSSTVRYTAPNRQPYIQFGTLGPGGWLLTSGPAIKAKELLAEHEGLVSFAEGQYNVTLERPKL